MGESKKTVGGKKIKIKDLNVKGGAKVTGGRKAGEGQQEYLVYTLKDVQVTSVSPSGNSS